MTPKAVLRTLLVASAAVGGLALPAGAASPDAEGWRPFTATWTISGSRETLPTEGDRDASIVNLSGTMTITSGQGIGRGLLGEVIGFDDGGKLLAGRAVFTDERGDQIYCALRGEPIGSGRLATASITGGSGRFAGIEGSFTLAWQYVVDSESGQVSGRSVNVEGRTRIAAGQHAGGP